MGARWDQLLLVLPRAAGPPSLQDLFPGALVSLEWAGPSLAKKGAEGSTGTS